MKLNPLTAIGSSRTRNDESGRPVSDARRVARRSGAVLAMLVAGFGAAAAQPPGAPPPAPEVQRGRYLVQVAGCNDCHTPGYPESGGKVDEKLWLTGSALGWRGPWGTTYPPNLRRVAHTLTEVQWLAHARKAWRPPMPWFNLRDMTDADLGAIHRYLRHLGPAGEPAPAYVPPGRAPAAAVVSFPLPPQ